MSASGNQSIRRSLFLNPGLGIQNLVPRSNVASSHANKATDGQEPRFSKHGSVRIASGLCVCVSFLAMSASC